MKKITLLLILLSSFTWAQIKVSVDISETVGGGVNIVTPATPGGSDWSEFAATDEGNGVFSYTFPSVAAGVTVEYVWKVYFTGGGDAQENLLFKIRGGDVENDLQANLPAQEQLNTDFFSYCNRTVMSTGASYTAQTYYFNSLRQPSVTYTEITVNAPASDNLVIDYSANGWSTFHGPGATNNADGTHTIIVDPSSAFEYKWVNLSTTTTEDLISCANDGVLINTDNSSFANRIHAAGQNRLDDFGVCPTTASNEDASLIESFILSNPTDKQWTVKTPNTNIKSVQVFNILGKRVYNATLNSNEVVIPARNLNSGIYIAKIQTEIGTKSLKLLRK